jgi:predicted AlkP superfamily phosphohydrolase/phosphomutase
LTDDDVREITGHLRISVAQKRAAGLHYLQAEAWDLFIIAFKEMHCCCHTFWDFTDVRHPAHDPARTSRLGDPSISILKHIDGAIGDLVAIAGPEAEIVVFSTTDIEPNGSLQHLMPKIVIRLNKHLAGNCESLPKPMSGWRCQMLPYNENVGAFRISHDRRIGDGDAPGTDQRVRVIEEIQSMLCDLTDADTGEKVVSSSSRPSTEFKGARTRSLPDLLIHYKSKVFPRAVVSSRLGRISVENPRMRPGNHVAGGFLIAAGTAMYTAADEVRSMSDFGPLAERVLRSSEFRLERGSAEKV